MKKAAIILTHYKPHARELFAKIHDYLTQRSIGVSVIDADNRPSIDSLTADTDVAITLGGDGTVLYAARLCAAGDVPVFPINLGKFGFIASIDPARWEQDMEAFINGMAPIDRRMLLSVTMGEENTLALNECVISGETRLQLLDFSVEIRGLVVATYRADGLIIATPTGSTGYSASAGGPIVDPRVSALLITPVCSFSLADRPLLLPADEQITIRLLSTRHTAASLAIDGRCWQQYTAENTLELTAAVKHAQLVGCTQHAFYTALQRKLNRCGTMPALGEIHA